MGKNSIKDKEDEGAKEGVLEEGEEKVEDEAAEEDIPHRPAPAEVVSDEEENSEIDPDKMGAEGAEFKLLTERKEKLEKTERILAVHDVVVQKLINKARDDLVWEQYM